MLIPLQGVIFRGVKTATVWMVLVLLTWTAMFFAGQAGIIASIDVTGERFPARRMIELFALSTTVYGLFYLKDSMQGWLTGTVEKKEAETRAVVETAPDGILTVDASGQVQSANEAAARIFGRDLEAWEGSEIESLVPTLAARPSVFDPEPMSSFGATEEHTGLARDLSSPEEFGLSTH
ncbi:MAG: PAS domain-containing protein [Persicimonas sp.]